MYSIVNLAAAEYYRCIQITEGVKLFLFHNRKIIYVKC